MANSYTSIKRVMLVREGSVRGRCLVDSPGKARKLMAKYWQNRKIADQESFVVATVNTILEVESIVEVSVGTLDCSLVHPRDVFKPAILDGARGVILSHNHPSGDTKPSSHDIDLTKRLVKAGEVLGIEVLDHVIYGEGSGETFSLAQNMRM